MDLRHKNCIISVAFNKVNFKRNTLEVEDFEKYIWKSFKFKICEQGDAGTVFSRHEVSHMEEALDCARRGRKGTGA